MKTRIILLALLGFVGVGVNAQSAYKRAYKKALEEQKMKKEVQNTRKEESQVPPSPSVVKEQVVFDRGNSLNKYGVVCGSFADKSNADQLATDLEMSGYMPTVVKSSESGWYRVLATTSNDFSEISSVKNRLSLQYVSCYILEAEVMFSGSFVSDVDVNLPQAKSQCENTFAVIIANENYERVPNVGYALNDGRTFKRYCNEVLGLPIDHIKMTEDATYGQMTELFGWLEQVSAAYKGEARVIVYYAGHGVPNANNGSAYLLPVDVSGNNTRAAYSLNGLFQELGALQAKSVTLFIDACFSGSNRGEGMLVADRGVGIRARNETPQGNMVVFAAAQGSEAAWPLDSERHGMFTYFLLKKLKESNGNASLSQLGEYIVENVVRKSAVANRKQTPSVSGAPNMGSDWKRMTLKD